MTSDQHQNFANEAVKRINKDGIEGDIVECGVWKGGMTMAMAFENMKTNVDRHFWLFDTFEGLPEPSSEKDDPRAKRIFNNVVGGNMSESRFHIRMLRVLSTGKNHSCSALPAASGVVQKFRLQIKFNSGLRPSACRCRPKLHVVSIPS